MLFSRRGFLSSIAAASVGYGADKGFVFPSEAFRYTDAATDFVIVRLTDPAHQSWLPAYFERAIARHGNFLIYASDRSGTVQAYRMDLKNGQSRVLTDATHLVPDSLTLTPDERSFCYLDSGVLNLRNLATLRTREVYRIEAGFEAGRGFGLSEDGLYAGLVEQKAGASRLRLISMRTGTAETLAESSEALSDPMPRPRRAGMLYRRGDGEMWLVNFDGAQNRKLRLAPGGLGPAIWSTDGRTVLYLSFPEDRKQITDSRIHAGYQRRRVDFVHQPVRQLQSQRGFKRVRGRERQQSLAILLLLVRSVKRELTLCEHRASDGRQVVPMFSPNSQRMFFQSDRDGKMAIYSMLVDRLVEETEQP